MAITVDDIGDMIVSTRKHEGELRWTDIASELQHYHALPQLLKEEKVLFDAGRGIQRNLQVEFGNAARNVGLYENDNVNVPDVMKTIDIPWRHTTTDYAIERREIAMNRKPERIVELIRTRRAASMISLAKRIETDFWSKPVDSSDETTPFGVFYWIVPNSTQGFNGGNPAGFTAGAGGLDSSVYTEWANWTDQYVEVSKDDLVDKMNLAYLKTDFMSPVDIPDYQRGADRYVIYCNLETYRKFRRIGERQNENIGNDIDAYNGKIRFNDNPIRWVPQLDTDATNPVLFINWAIFFIGFLEGEYMNEDKPRRAPNQHTVVKVHIDLSWNTVCDNRRRLAALTL